MGLLALVLIQRLAVLRVGVHCSIESRLSCSPSSESNTRSIHSGHREKSTATWERPWAAVLFVSRAYPPSLDALRSTTRRLLTVGFRSLTSWSVPIHSPSQHVCLRRLATTPDHDCVVPQYSAERFGNSTNPSTSSQRMLTRAMQGDILQTLENVVVRSVFKEIFGLSSKRVVVGSSPAGCTELSLLLFADRDFVALNQ